MNWIKKITISLILFNISIHAYGQSLNDFPEDDRGKCRANSAIYSGHELVTKVTKEYPIYIGPQEKTVETEIVRNFFSPPTYEMAIDTIISMGKELVIAKRKEIPSDDYLDLEIVKKPEKVDNKLIEWRTYTNIVIEKPEAKAVFIRVLCGSEITDEIIFQIRDKLLEAGYPVDVLNARMDHELRYYLIEYQRDNLLPLGNLNYPTLEKLEIVY